MFEITFLATGTIEKCHATDDCVYVLSDGTYEEVMNTPIWCNHCQKVTLGESIGSLHELDTAITDASKPDTEAGRFYVEMYPKQKDREASIRFYQCVLTKRRKWLVDRISPAKCLTCGTVDIIHLSGRVDTSVEAISIRHTGFCSLLGKPRYFSSEGDRIEHTPTPRKTELPKRKWWQFWK